jgi:hypothetical protein
MIVSLFSSRGGVLLYTRLRLYHAIPKIPICHKKCFNDTIDICDEEKQCNDNNCKNNIEDGSLMEIENICKVEDGRRHTYEHDNIEDDP